MATVCVVTTSRADYGLLYWPMKLILECPRLDLQLVVAGTHLLGEFGRTVDEIRADGFTVDREVELLVGRDDPQAVVDALGRFTSRMGVVLAELEPDLVLVLGDRWEILGPVQAAYLLGIPVGHVAGGDVTLGALDDGVRHAVTKLSQLHFPTNDVAADRLRRMGEPPERIHQVGSPGLDRIRRLRPLSRGEVGEALGRPLTSRVLMLAYHRATRVPGHQEEELEAILSAMTRLEGDWTFVVSGSNVDPGASGVTRRLRSHAEADDRAVWVASAGQELWLSLMREADVLLGNSSAGLYEAPFLGTPSVNVGIRQEGRPRADSVVDVPGTSGAIIEGVQRALRMGRAGGKTPYGDGHAAERMIAVLEAVEDFKALLVKSYYDEETS